MIVVSTSMIEFWSDFYFPHKVQVVKRYDEAFIWCHAQFQGVGAITHEWGRMKWEFHPTARYCAVPRQARNMDFNRLHHFWFKESNDAALCKMFWEGVDEQ